MASNRLGTCFSITTWGESHGPAMGVVIDGCPAGLTINEEIINSDLARRASSGKNPYTTPRAEPDQAQILSGVFEGKTTGAPISLLIENRNARTSAYSAIKDTLRPGHANYTYLKKYGCFDYRGGGRASARETVCRVAAGAVARAFLSHHGIEIAAAIQSIGPIHAAGHTRALEALITARNQSLIFCADPAAADLMMQHIAAAKAEGDSVGGTVAFYASGLPIGLGDPVYEKLPANLAKAMLSIPATKAFALGEGMAASEKKGSEHNDGFQIDPHAKTPTIQLSSNHAGGTLGGISTGELLYGTVAFKPTSSIQKPQASTTLDGKPVAFSLPPGSRHDPCVAIRAVPVVEAMLALTLADALLMQRLCQLD